MHKLQLILRDAHIVGNESQSSGGGINMNEHADLVGTNVTFADNMAFSENKGAINAYPGSSVKINGGSLLRNSAVTDGAADYVPHAALSVTEDTILYAVWQVDSYKVTYFANNGTLEAYQIAVPYGSTHYVLSIDELSFFYLGKEFKGWTTNQDGSGTAYQSGNNMPIWGDISVYAQWDDSLYRVQFDTQGGSFNPPDEMVVHRQRVPEPPLPTKEGHLFEGWFTAENMRWHFEDPVTKSMKLYAHWSLERFEIIYKANEGIGSDITDEVMYGEEYLVKENSFDREDYTFIGWNSEPDSAGSYYEPGQKIFIKTDTVLYAQWNPADFTIAAEGFSKHYDAQERGVTLSGVRDSDTITYFIGTDEVDNTFKDVIDATVRAVVVRNGVQAEACARVLIEPAALTIKTGSASKHYDEEPLINNEV